MEVDSTAAADESYRVSRVTSRSKSIVNVVRKNFQFIAMILSVVLGTIIGILVHNAVQRSKDPSTEELVMYIKFPGDIFIRMLRMSILPLTISSIVVALAEIEASSAGKLGKRTFIYYLTTTVFGCVLGIALMKIIRPGEGSTVEEEAGVSHRISAIDSFLDLIRNMFPENLVEATFRSSQTTYKENRVNFKYEKVNISDYNSSIQEMSTFLKKNTVLPWRSGNIEQITIISNGVRYTYGGTIKKHGTNVLGLIVFSVALGIVIRRLKDDGHPLLDFFSSLLKAVMMLISAIMWLAPVGILSLIAGSLAEVEDIIGTFHAVALYIVTLLSGMFIQSFLVYPLIYFVMVRKNPFTFLSGIIPVMITAFGTSSSSATLPVTIRCVTENNNVDRRVAQFVLPIGATCNMDGSALTFAVAVLFIANLEKVSLSFGEMILTFLVSVFVSAGASGIPSAGLSYTILCLEAVGLPTRHIGLIFATEWIGDRAITVTNVMGDAYGAGIISHISARYLSSDIEKISASDREDEATTETSL